MKRIFISIIAAALVLGACAAADDDSTEELTPMDDPATNAASSPASDEPIPVEPNEGIGDGASAPDLPVVSPDLAAEIDLATADLAERLGTDDLIEVVVAFEVTWPDRSLGCPEPDMAYAQVLVDGYRIELAVGDEVYAYHGAGGEDPFLCEQADGRLTADDLEPVGGSAAPSDPGEDDESRAPVTGALAGLVDRALEDLAGRLGSADGITVVSATSVVWPDGSIGCPQEGIEYPQVQVEGARIVLTAGGAKYDYHAGGNRGLFLCEGSK